MTVPGLEVRLMNALEKITDKTIPETLVKIEINIFCNINQNCIRTANINGTN